MQFAGRTSKKQHPLLVLVEEKEGTGSSTWHAATAQAVFSTACSLL
jgi:aconitase A